MKKEDLANLVARGLKKALASNKNIKKRFKVMGIWPLKDMRALDNTMAPSEA